MSELGRKMMDEAREKFLEAFETKMKEIVEKYGLNPDDKTIEIQQYYNKGNPLKFQFQIRKGGILLEAFDMEMNILGEVDPNAELINQRRS